MEHHGTYSVSWRAKTLSWQKELEIETSQRVWTVFWTRVFSELLIMETTKIRLGLDITLERRHYGSCCMPLFFSFFLLVVVCLSHISFHYMR